jgi:hypothetical protein
MATFIWPPEVAWPPPLSILQNYDVVPPAVAKLTEEGVLHTFNPRYREEKDPMTKVIIVGEIYNAGLEVGGGPMPGGPGAPVDPGYGRPGWSPVDPGYGRPIFHPGHPDHGLPSSPGHPANRPPGSWGGPVDPGFGWGGGERPDAGLPGQPGHPGNWVPGSGYPTGGPIIPPQEGTTVPEDVYAPTPPPEEIASQYIVSVYDPKTMTWTTKTYPPR